MDDYGYDISGGGGFLGKLLAVLIGIIIGVVGVFAGVAAGGYFYLNRPVSTVSNEISGLTGLQYDLNAYVSEDYAEKTVLTLIGDTANALIGFASGTGTLGDINNISPFLGESLSTFTTSLHEETGVALDPAVMMTKTSVELPGYIKETVNNTPAGELLHALGGELSPIMMAVCYGTKDVDYKINPETKKVEMIGNATPTLVIDLLGGNAEDSILRTPLDSIIELDHTSAISMHITYGERDLHYSYDPATDIVDMLPQRIAIDEAGDVYNEYGDVKGGTYDSENNTYTETDGTVYLVESTPIDTLTTENNTLANVYYLTDENGKYVDYRSATIGDLANGSTIDKMMLRMTIAELLGEDHVQEDSLLYHVKDETIESLPEAIENLTITQIFEDKIYKEDGSINPEWWYLLHDETVCTKNHTDCDGTCIEAYTITEMDGMIGNMRNNIDVSSLQKLKDDGMITKLDQNTLDKEIKPSIGTVPIDYTPETGKTKLGDLTVNELMEYMNAVFTAIDNVTNAT